MSEVVDKLTDTVEVRTLLTRVKCPNKSCGAYLEHDGRTRSATGLHGGPSEYRHHCNKCGAGYWLKQVFPKVSYEPVEAENGAV